MLWRPTTCSSWIITSVRSAWSHLLLLLVFMSFVSLPVGCHAFVSPMLALLGARFCLGLWSICHETEQLQLPIYSIRRKAPLGLCTTVHHRDFPLVRLAWWILDACTQLLPSPCQPGLVSNGKSLFGRGSFGHDL